MYVESVENFFPNLSAIRCSRGVSLEQIVLSTKISLHYLLAIEQGCFDKLPEGIYRTSYLRQYAQAIDYDEEQLLDIYRARVGPDNWEVREVLEKVSGQVSALQRLVRWITALLHGHRTAQPQQQ